MKQIHNVKPAPIGVLTKLLKILEVLRRAQSGLSLKEVAGQTGINKSTAYRFLAHLEREGYLLRDESGHYMLGLDLLRLGPHSGSYSTLRDVARPALRELLLATGETVNLCVLDEGTVLYLDVLESPHEFRLVAKIGTRRLLHCTATGKSLAAFYPDKEAEPLLASIRFQPLTPHTITNMAAFRKELESVREQGFALDNEETLIGLRCVGAPVLDSRRQAVAAVSVAGPVTRISEDKLPIFAEAVKEAGRKITSRLGYLDVGNGVIQVQSPPPSRSNVA